MILLVEQQMNTVSSITRFAGGQYEICNYTDKLIERKANAKGVPGMGYTVVTEGCPMKNKE